MSTHAHDAGIPTWDLADRLTKALREARVGHGEMAEYLGVTRNTVGNYTAGRRTPNLAILRLWAMRTGVPLEWLETGEVRAAGPGPEGERDPLAATPLHPDQSSDHTGRQVRHLSIAA